MTDQTADVQFGRPFVLVRDTDVSGVSGTGIVANGIQWPDGQAAIHWTGSAYPTTTPHPGGMDSVTAVHGHGGATRIVWEPNAIPQAEYSSVWPELVGWVQAAHEDGEQIDPGQLLEYMRELKRRALAPVRRWMDGVRDAAGQPTQHHIPCGQCGAPWSDGHGQPGDPCPAAGQTPTTEQPVVAYRDPNNPRVLLCRQHGQSWHAITPVTAEDLPDGGICTFGRLSSNECGRDVLAGQAAVEQPAEAQPADRARGGAYDNLYAELTRGVSHAQVRHHLITEYRAEVLREAATVLWHQTNGLTQYGDGVRWACERLRRMADEETR